MYFVNAYNYKFNKNINNVIAYFNAYNYNFNKTV